MTTAEKMAHRAKGHTGGISRTDEQGRPRRGWMFCEDPGCIEVIRKRNGPLCFGHKGTSR